MQQARPIIFFQLSLEQDLQDERGLDYVRRVFPQYSISPPPLFLSTLQCYFRSISEFLKILVISCHFMVPIYKAEQRRSIAN